VTKSAVATGTATPTAGQAGEHRSAAANCDPPFVVDGNGIEHFKPGCL
jgi:hypothetical protein